MSSTPNDQASLKPSAVLTGDIVGSRELGGSEITEIFQTLERCAVTQAAWFDAPLNFTRHRGDGWQVVVNHSQYALRSAIAFRAALRGLGAGYDSYIGIAAGPIDTYGTDLNAETSEVFARSGAALEDLKTHSTPRMAHADPGPYNAATILADHLVQSWTTVQAQTVAAVLAPDAPATHAQIAERLGKSRQAVTKALKAAGFDHLNLALATLERDQSP
ncbi:MarR family transcriptional regulator [Oceanicola sp. D3]|uniref:MarR family transcriptional regulator n=1 Tax=Oceanicola sp. D3 TaxID=2587163 RepID=UPI00111F3408|nr:MarR family transcriptional regulator [Oceanicola sp. D3]QDC09363.1 MarR family transcriptional regulator [Oceanicola sp. D3]